MKTIAYMRVSTDAQTKGNGIAQQRTDIIAWAFQNKVTIDEWLEEAETGTKDDRAVIERLLARARAGDVFTLVLDRVNRLGRTALVSLKLKDELERAGVTVVFVQQAFTDDPAGKLMFTMFSGLAEYERSEWLKRMQTCKHAAVRRKGTFRGGKVPFGYRVLGNGQLGIDGHAAGLVRLCFDMRLAGSTLIDIQKATGLALGTLHNILKRRPQYEARAAFGNTQPEAGVKIAHPPILSSKDPDNPRMHA